MAEAAFSHRAHDKQIPKLEGDKWPLQKGHLYSEIRLEPKGNVASHPPQGREGVRGVHYQLHKAERNCEQAFEAYSRWQVEVDVLTKEQMNLSKST